MMSWFKDQGNMSLKLRVAWVKYIKYLPSILSILVMFCIPLILTLFFTSYMSLNGYSPTEATSEEIKNHYNDRAWAFSILNLGKEIPYYTISPNFENAGFAATVESSIFGRRISKINFSYDELTCITNKFGDLNQEKLFALKDIAWSDCKFKKNFEWGITTTDAKPVMDINISNIGFIIIYFGIFIVTNGFFILCLESFLILRRLFRGVLA